MLFKFNFKRNIRYLLILCYSFHASSILYALDCSNIRQLIIYFLRTHYSIHDFDSEVSKRTLNNFIDSWDPRKTIFLESDVIEFRFNV